MRQPSEWLSATDYMHFVTLRTNVQGNWFVEAKDCLAILRTFESFRERHGLECMGYVLMPDRLHALLMQYGSGGMVRKLIQDFRKTTASELRDSEYPGRTLWRMQYEDVSMPDPATVAERIQYMHVQPVEAGLVSQPEDYAWSSMRDLMGTATGPVTLARVEF